MHFFITTYIFFYEIKKKGMSNYKRFNKIEKFPKIKENSKFCIVISEFCVKIFYIYKINKQECSAKFNTKEAMSKKSCKRGCDCAPFPKISGGPILSRASTVGYSRPTVPPNHWKKQSDESPKYINNNTPPYIDHPSRARKKPPNNIVSWAWSSTGGRNSSRYRGWARKCRCSGIGRSTNTPCKCPDWPICKFLRKNSFSSRNSRLLEKNRWRKWEFRKIRRRKKNWSWKIFIFIYFLREIGKMHDEKER